MADPTDSVELALDELQNEPLPTHTREHPAPPEDEVEIDYADDGLEPRQESASRLPEPERTAPQPPPREISPQEGVDELRAKLLASDRARQEAEARANQAEQARAQATGSVQEAQTQFLQSALDGAKQTMAILKANLAEAYAVQDFAQVAELQAELTEATLRKQQIDYGLEELKTRQPQPQPSPQRAPPRQADPVETIASQLTPNAAAWVRAHPEFITDRRKNRRLLDAHDDAMDAGLTADTPEYIRFVEDQVLGGSSQPRTVERREPVAEQPRRSAPPPAPVSRGNGAGASNPTRVTLTREQRETAHENFPDEMRKDPTGKLAERAYAQNMLILQREGRMKVN